MGIKIVYSVVGFTSVSAVLLLTAAMLPQHTVSFFSLYAVRVARMSTYMASVSVESKDNDFCKALKSMVPQEKLGWCSGLDSITGTQEMQLRFCSAALERIWPTFCVGLSWAYVLGMLLLMFIVINLGLQIGAMYLLLDYGGRKANPMYRKASMGTLGAGFFCLVFLAAVYGAQVISNLSSIRTAGLGSIFAAVLSVSKGTGVSWGYLILWVGIFFQCVALCLYTQAKSSTLEEKYLDEKSRREFQEDLGARSPESDLINIGTGTNYGAASTAFSSAAEFQDRAYQAQLYRQQAVQQQQLQQLQQQHLQQQLWQQQQQQQQPGCQGALSDFGI